MQQPLDPPEVPDIEPCREWCDAYDTLHAFDKKLSDLTDTGIINTDILSVYELLVKLLDDLLISCEDKAVEYGYKTKRSQ